MSKSDSKALIDASQSDAGFFSIYKSGQGYWTRLLTFLGFLLLGALTAHFLYSQTKGWLSTDATTSRSIALGIAAGFMAAWLLVEHVVLNKQKNAEFLIATDSEMKKVNWTSRRELIGSTKVVIFFMFLTTFVLFSYDLVFHTIFWAMTVLKEAPPFIPQ